MSDIPGRDDDFRFSSQIVDTDGTTDRSLQICRETPSL